MTPEKLAMEIRKYRAMTYENAIKAAGRFVQKDIRDVFLIYKNAIISDQVLQAVRKDVLAMFSGRKKYIDLLSEYGFYFQIFGPTGKKGRYLKTAFDYDSMHCLLDNYANRLMIMGVDDDYLILPALAQELKDVKLN